MATTMENPYILADLPHPLGSAGNRILATSVTVGDGSRKRKRAELAVGIDGEGLNIYQVQPSKLLTSYALSPQTSLTCAPCSTRYSATTSSAARRFTYASTLDPKPRVTCFFETAETKPNSSSTSAVAYSTASFAISTDLSPIVHLEVVSAVPDDLSSEIRHDLLVIHEHGEMEVLSGDLKSQRWSRPTNALFAAERSSSNSHQVEQLRVEYAFLTDANTACKGLLRGREDVIALLNSAVELPERDRASVSVLILVTRPADDALLAEQGRSVHIVSIRASSNKGTLAMTGAGHCLLQYALPRPHGDRMILREPQFSFHAGTGTMYFLSGGQLTIYDLSGTVPRVSTQLQLDDSKMSSFLRLSPTLGMAVSQRAVTVYDLKYQSVQGTVALGEDLLGASESKKAGSAGQKRAKVSVKLLAYDSNIDLVVGLAGTRLVGFPVVVGGNDTPGTRKRRRECSLIDSIGRGIKSSKRLHGSSSNNALPRSLGELLPVMAGDPAWRQRQADLNRCVEDNDVEQFEHILADHLGITIKESGAHKEGQAKNLPEWDLSGTRIARHAAQIAEIRFSLRKMFAISDEPSSQSVDGHLENQRESTGPRLRIAFYAPNVANWLIQTGSLSRANVESALQEAPSMSFQRSSSITSGQFIDSLVEFDPELHLLLAVLLSPTILEVKDIVHVIRHILRSLQFPEVQKKPLQLTDGSHEDTQEEQLDLAIQDAQDDAEDDLRLAFSTLETGSNVREHALSVSLRKLCQFPAATTTRALKSELAADELLSFIHLLRFELATGGWTSRYVDSFDEDDPMNGGSGEQPANTASDRGVGLICGLLNCALDAVGTVGWIHSASLTGTSAESANDPNSTQNLVTFLKAEVSAALEGIEEASYLGGLLTEVLRYGKSMADATAVPASSKQQQRISASTSHGGPPATPGPQKSLPPGAGALSTPAAAAAFTTPRIDAPLATPASAFTRSTPYKASIGAVAPGTITTIPVGGYTDDTNSKVLPLGLKAEQTISKTKVGAGGEVMRRSARDIGRLKSMKVGKYSFEKIVV
ncbi:hypothetical protein L228DRAFT_258267 [Xylona heveae TC161]|uniref:Utp8 beta-propeller domain-containing protein n=1 Tax=Xylona heveae (strain CBS 132557 / TC161) TaxID=1328760 RepID=A0A165K2K5_XYLHT|nr:hypothetical protein L228DRAFT_258267 [Xylona heveae TC161]KZF26912.1 hypothetical protein L228DRAFT_258267 [Xylona heveae TC161]